MIQDGLDMHTCVYVYVCMHMCVCIRVCVCVCVCVYSVNVPYLRCLGTVSDLNFFCILHYLPIHSKTSYIYDTYSKKRYPFYLQK
jgi:hypothetical protein